MANREQLTTQTVEKFSPRQLRGTLMAGLALTLALASGCSPKVAEPNRATAIENPAKSGEVETKMSESETKYAEYLKTLSPEQVAVRESLNPDALAEMDEAQLTEAFTIHADEVTVDGKIDPALYAEAFAARSQAINNSGISDKEYAKWGGVKNFGLDTISKVADAYSSVQTQALMGKVGDSEGVELLLNRGSTVDDAINNKSRHAPKERYHYRIVVEPDTIEFTENDNVTSDIRFKVHLSDNWEKDTMQQYMSLTIEPADGSSAWNLQGLYITEDGKVLPTESSYK